jgi:hypothetical protein
MDRCIIDRVDVQIAVIETIAAAQWKVHGRQAVVAGESDASKNFFGFLYPIFCHWTKISLDARMAKGKMIVLTRFAQ